MLYGTQMYTWLEDYLYLGLSSAFKCFTCTRIQLINTRLALSRSPCSPLPSLSSPLPLSKQGSELESTRKNHFAILT